METHVDVIDTGDFFALVVVENVRHQGCAIRARCWLLEAVKFVKHNKAAFEKLPVVYFFVCATMREDTPNITMKYWRT